jgi:hypothetical protein
MPASFSPLNHKYSEKIKDKKAEVNIRKSDNVNFLNIFFICCNVELLINNY